MATVGQKLTFLMKNGAYRIADGALGEALHVDRSTVNKWRKGVLRFDKAQYASSAADFFIGNLDKSWLLSLLGMTEADFPDDSELRGRMVAFLFDGRDIILKPDASGVITTDRHVKTDGCFLGVQGLFDALSLFAVRLAEKETRQPLCVYLSSEYCGLLLDHSADLLWDYLYKINENRPVRIVFERWRETGRVAEILGQLIPFILQKKVELYYIPSTERFFCYNVSFLSEDNCIVMTTEPAGSVGTCVSIYVDSQEFVVPMSKVMSKLEKMARPIAKFIETPKAETICVNAMLAEEGDIGALFDGINPLYAAEDSFESLLKACGLRYPERRHHVKRFQEQREAFKHFLAGNRSREIFSLNAIDEYIASAGVRLHELSFPAVRVDACLSFLVDILRGMIDALNEFGNLQIILARELDCRDAVWRLKEDRAILLHCFNKEEKVCVYSENGLFIGHYTSLLENTYHGKYTIRGKSNVMMALQKRIDQICRIGEEGAHET